MKSHIVLGRGKLAILRMQYCICNLRGYYCFDVISEPKFPML